MIVSPSICNLLALTSPAAPYTTALLLDTLPAVTPANKLSSSVVELSPVNLFNSVTEDVTLLPAIWRVVILTSPASPYTTDFPLTIDPAPAPSTRLISFAEAVTRTLFNLRPPSTSSWDAIFNTWLPPVAPIVTTPESLWVTALEFSDDPMAEIPLIKPNADSSTVVAPKTRFPLTVTSDENTEALSDVIDPTRSGAYSSIVTLPLVLPSSVSVAANAKVSLLSSQISDLLEILELPPPPLVNTIPKSWAVPVLPSPNFISLSETV